MSTNTDYLKQSEFSLAAYANLSLGISTVDYQDALLEAGFSVPQAKLFVATYSVKAVFNDNSNGLSVTVFEDKDGQKFLAIRGTNDLQDVLSDHRSVNKKHFKNNGVC